MVQWFLRHRVFLRTQVRDAFELFLLPGVAVVLPWAWSFRIFQLLAQAPWLYRAHCKAALEQAQLRGWAQDKTQWLHARRLVTLVDHADYFLVRTRSDAWLKRHMRVQGIWPTPDEAALLCTFHWGAGMWSLRHARAAQLKAHILVAPVDGDQFVGRPVLQHYAVVRTAAIAECLGTSTLDTSNSLRPALRALRQREQVMAVIDVPADAVSTSKTVDLLGMPARVPRALLRLAVDQGVPVSVFLVGINLSTGQRDLRIVSMGVFHDVDTLIDAVFLKLDEAIRDSPAAWHFWSEASRFFVSDGSA